MANNAALTLPVPLLRIIALESDAPTNTIGVGGMKLPVPVLSARGFAAPAVTCDLAIPTPVLLARGLTAVVGRAAMVLPQWTFLAHGFVTLEGTVAMALPTPQISAAGPNTAKLVLPTPVLSIVGRAGVTGRVVMNLPVPLLGATGLNPAVLSVAMSMPVPVLTSVGLAGNLGRFDNALRVMLLAAQGVTGTVGRAALTLPIMELSAAGHGPMIGMATLTLPMVRIIATGVAMQTEAQDNAAPVKAIVMNVEMGGLSHYTNYNFNGFAMFNGMALASSPDGVFVVDAGDTDNGALIDAAARGINTDFGTSYLKRIDRCYVGYRTNGNLVLRVFTDEINQRDYLLRATGKDGLHGNHAKIGKGLAARYWQFELRNQGGADFELNSLELKPTNLRRRIGGGDA